MKATLKILGAAILSIVCISSLADGHRNGPIDRGEKIERLAETLELSEEQIVSVKAIFDSTREQHNSLREAEDNSRKQMKTFNDGIREQLSEVLDEDQLLQFDQMQSRRKMRKHKGDMPH